jgi:hypothetical protein
MELGALQGREVAKNNRPYDCGRCGRIFKILTTSAYKSFPYRKIILFHLQMASLVL